MPTQELTTPTNTVMADLATPTFLSHLKSLYPVHAASLEYNPWYIIVAVAFAASNRPEAVPLVFQYAMKEIEGSGQDEKLLLVRRFRDAIFKSGLISGYPKTINGLKSLFDGTPEDLRDSKPLRDVTLSTSDFDERGRGFFERTYGSTAPPVQSFLESIYPDMAWFSTHAYGITYSFFDVLTPVETSYVLCAALIATDTPLQIGWHLNGALRNGATLEEARAVRIIAIEVAKESGVVWRKEVPEIEGL